MKRMKRKKFQFVWWNNWHGVKFINCEKNKVPSAYYVCFDWGILLGFLEIRHWRQKPLDQKRFNEIYAGEN